MTARFGLRILLAMVVTLVALGNPLFAQVKSSAITGTVTDQSGAVMPNVTITVTQQETNTSTKTESGSNGGYTVPYLPIGHYTLSVTAPGFSTYRKTDIVLAGGATVRADVPLAIGNTTATIEVQANALAIQTENATVSNAISEQSIANLPNINGNSLYYATLESGVVGTPQQLTSTNLGVGYRDRRDMSGMRINGGQIGSNDVLLDGISVQGAAWHETAVLPNPDALSEVRVTTNNFTADIGLAQGIVSQTTKGGTNKFHGDLNFMMRNEDLNANSFSNNHQGIARPRYRLLQGGGSVGGPIIIPRLFNGKNKLFFFASFLRLTHSDAVTLQTTVPTALERQGDFSQTMVKEKTGAAVPVHIYNPYSVTPSGSNYLRTQYTNAIITNPDPYGLKILQGYPLPNYTKDASLYPLAGGGGQDVYHTNNYYFRGNQPESRNSLNARVDYKPSDNQSIYFTGGFSKGSIISPNQWGTAANGPWKYQTAQIGDTKDLNPYGAVGDTIVLNPTTVLDVRWGLTRIHTQSQINQAAGNPADYGMPSFVSATSPRPGSLPSMAALAPYGALNNTNYTNKIENQTNQFVVGSINKQLSSHSLKFGAEYRVYLQNFTDYQLQAPTLSSTAVTGSIAAASGANSSSIATVQDQGFLPAGLAVGAQGWLMNPGTAPRLAVVSKYLAMYGQDSWRVNKNLLLTVGIRYDIQPGPTERHNHMSSYVLDKANPFPMTAPVGITASPKAALGYLTFPGVEGYSRNLYETSWKDVAPRIGATYQLTPKTVLRGGFGRNFLPSNTGYNANTTIYNPTAWSDAVNPIPFGLAPAGVAIGTFSQASNTYVVPGAGATQSAANYGLPSAVTIFNRNQYKTGHTDQWNFVIERELSPTWLVNASYVGSIGGTLPWRGFLINGPFAVDPGQLQTWRTAWVASNGVTDPAQVQVPNPFPALVGKAPGASGGKTITAMQAAEPYVGSLGVTNYVSIGSSAYHAFVAKVQHSMSHGLMLGANYTWSKATGNVGNAATQTFAESQQNNSSAPTGGVDYVNLNNNHSILDYDITQRLVVNWTYALPLGKGKLVNANNRLVNEIIGGWEVSGVVNWQGGMPWGPSCAATTTTLNPAGTLNGRCNRVAGEPIELPKDKQRYYSGSETLTLPNGRVITPAVNTFMKWNPDAWSEPIVTMANGKVFVDQYTLGTTPLSIGYLRTPGITNVNLSVIKRFTIREGLGFDIHVNATNALNHVNHQITIATDNTNQVNAITTAGSTAGRNGTPS